MAQAWPLIRTDRLPLVAGTQPRPYRSRPRSAMAAATLWNSGFGVAVMAAKLGNRR